MKMKLIANMAGLAFVASIAYASETLRDSSGAAEKIESAFEAVCTGKEDSKVVMELYSRPGVPGFSAGYGLNFVAVTCKNSRVTGIYIMPRDRISDGSHLLVP